MSGCVQRTVAAEAQLWTRVTAIECLGGTSRCGMRSWGESLHARGANRGVGRGRKNQ